MVKGRRQQLKEEIKKLYKERAKYDDRGMFNQNRDMIDKKLNPLEGELKGIQETAKQIFEDIEDMPEAYWVVCRDYIVKIRKKWLGK